MSVAMIKHMIGIVTQLALSRHRNASLEFEMLRSCLLCAVTSTLRLYCRRTGKANRDAIVLYDWCMPLDMILDKQ
jgi:hypothetical protein